ncbi:hypothetical protein H2200_003139 [Cladophialophora chaetospira]|uniref:Uncharacterized protein n=1 Tax=Cladophialophora chaetospira TaxID=386627 RepID=A0AA38XGS4_9EURO|nr:hypothetical protein H2200_003139 [Cladophialophora chaetospira]
MTSSQPDLEQDVAQAQRIVRDYSRFLHTSTLATCVLAPILIALPPRKIDLFTFSLSGAFIAAVDYQVKERTSLGIMGHASRRFILKEPSKRPVQDDVSTQWQQPSRLLEEPSPRVVQTSALQQRAQEDWKQQRLKEEQEKLDQGEGYWDMIKDQVWQVWNQEEKKVEELKEKDEVVVREREVKG